MCVFLLIIVRWDRWTWVTWLEQATVRDRRSGAYSLTASGTWGKPEYKPNPGKSGTSLARSIAIDPVLAQV